MHATLTILKTEHRRLGAVLQCLDAVLADAASNRMAPDFPLYYAVIRYIEDFLFRHHHPKEDQFLFPRLRERCQEAESLTRELERQHERGYELLDGLRKSLEVYERHVGEEVRADFESAVRAYHRYEWDHMQRQREENELLPLACAHLTDDDWQEIDSVFSNILDPVFGEPAGEEFRRLFEEITKRVPASRNLR